MKKRRREHSDNLQGAFENIAEKKALPLIHDLHGDGIAEIFYSQRFNKFA